MAVEISGFFIPIAVTMIDSLLYTYIASLKNVSDKHKENMLLGVRITVQIIAILLLLAVIMALFFMGIRSNIKIVAIGSSILFCLRLCGLIFFAAYEFTFLSMFAHLFFYSVFMFGGLREFLRV